MAYNAYQNQDGSQQRVDVVPALTFDELPFQIALDRIPFDRGGSANIRKGRIIGSGPPEVEVAVKVFGAILTPVKEKLLVRELRAARTVSLSHPSILGFLGTADVGEQKAIVSFYMGNSNMMAYMQANPGCEKKKLIIQVAEAVEFLHRSAGLVHGDIKCTNVLISDLGDALLADFGLSTFIEKSQFATTTLSEIRKMNTLQFTAPELLLGDEDSEKTLSKTRETDVYAFGMLILEAMLEQSPWGSKSNREVMAAICSYKYPPRPTRDGAFVSISYLWWEICCSCWRMHPDIRPPIHRVLSDLRDSEPVRRAGCRQLPFQERMAVATYTPDGRTIVASTYEGAIMLFDIATGHIRHLSRAAEDPESEEFMRPAVSPDGRRIACFVEQTVLVLDATSGVPAISIPHNGYPTCVAYSRDGTRIASGGSGKIHLWDAATGAAVGWHTEGHNRLIGAVSFSPDGSCLASASADGNIRLWDSMTCAPMATLTLPHPCDVHSIDFSPVSMHMVAGDDGGRVVIWDVREGRPTHTFDPEWGGASLDVAFSPSGRFVASGSELGMIGIWDVQDGKLVGDPLDAPTSHVRSVAFSPDGKSLITVARDDKVRVWNLFS